MTKEQMQGSRLLLKALKEQGVELIFGYPGGAVLPLYDALYDGEIPHVLTRHEQGALHAAEGYAKVTGKPGVAVLTSGPGATNAITGIAYAMSDSIPLIVFTGQVATSGIGKDAFQEADILGITMPIVKHSYQVRSAKELPQIIAEAFYIANTGRKGPVVIDLPKNISLETAEKIPTKPVDLPHYQPNVIANPVQIQKLVAALSQAEKPVVLAGAGVLHAQATAELQQFVQAYNIPVLTTLLGLGALPNQSPLFLGMGGIHGSFAANMALTDCDLLINLGSRFDDRLASNPEKFAPNARIVHVDIDPAEIGKVIQTEIPIVADVKNVLRELLNCDIPMKDTSEWYETNQRRKYEHPFSYKLEESDGIKPQRVIEIIGKITNGEAIIATDVGQHQMWTAQFYPFNHANQLVTSGGLGTMGYGIPAGIGAKLGAMDKEVVVFVGDGGFQMTNQELAILNEYGLSIKFVLLNNQSLGMVRQWQESFFHERRSESVFKTQPDFMKLAQAYQIASIKLTNPETLEQELAQAFTFKGSMLIEVAISQTEHVLPMVPTGCANNEMRGVE